MSNRIGGIGLSMALLLAAAGLAPAQASPIAFDEASGAIPFLSQIVQFGGSGLAGAIWFDYDRDGRVDLFLPNGAGQANALYHNDGNGHFSDRAVQAGVAASVGIGGGIAADLDNDGYQELVLISDRNILTVPGTITVVLYRNNGDGTFTDVTAGSGLVGLDSSVSLAAGDIDNDGDLDLFFAAPGSVVLLRQDENRMYRNDGDLQFTDISAAAGVNTSLGGCVATFSYYDDDPYIDLFVANCADVHLGLTPMELFHNNGDGTFTNIAPSVGMVENGLLMGLAFGDYDNDGDVDVFVSNAGDAPPAGVLPHPFYRHESDGTYTNLASALNTGQYRWGWGNAMMDFDDDGWLDLFFTGAFPSPFDPSVYLGPNGEANYGVLLANHHDGTFTDQSASLGHDFRHDFSSGVAAADYDDDGYEDLLVMVTYAPPLSASGQPVLLHNRGGHNRWLKVRTVGTVSNRDGVGARVTVRSGGLTQLREIYAGSSLSSMHEQTQTFGLGRARRGTVDVRWPSGYVNRLYDVPAGSKVAFSEVPCSFDDPALSLPQLTRCEVAALHELRQAGLVDPGLAGRLLASAVRGWLETH
jgi:hypothetical protein